MNDIRTFAMLEGKFSFTNLLEAGKSRRYIIVSFLAVLELMKIGVLWIAQEQPFDDIIITYREEKVSNG